jgi:hypothetical protein
MVAFVYARYVQTAANREASEYDIAIKRMNEAVNLIEERTAKFEAITFHEKNVADSLTVSCKQKEK